MDAVCSLAYVSHNNRYADLLFEVVSRRYDAPAAVLLSTNKPFSEWSTVFPHAACVVTLVDRLLHRAEVPARLPASSASLHCARVAAGDACSVGVPTHERSTTWTQSRRCLIAPIVASEDRTIAAAALLAGPGVSGPDLARCQTEIAVLNDSSIAVADREKEIAKALAEPMSPRETVYMSLDPLAYAVRVRAPSLVLQGGSDRHVPPVSAERIADAMRRGGNSNVTVRIFPQPSHMLVPDPEGLASVWKAAVTSPNQVQA